MRRRRAPQRVESDDESESDDAEVSNVDVVLAQGDDAAGQGVVYSEVPKTTSGMLLVHVAIVLFGLLLIWRDYIF